MCSFSPHRFVFPSICLACDRISAPMQKGYKTFPKHSPNTSFSRASCCTRHKLVCAANRKTLCRKNRKSSPDSGPSISDARQQTYVTCVRFSGSHHGPVVAHAAVCREARLQVLRDAGVVRRTQMRMRSLARPPPHHAVTNLQRHCGGS